MNAVWTHRGLACLCIGQYSRLDCRISAAIHALWQIVLYVCFRTRLLVSRAGLEGEVPSKNLFCGAACGPAKQ